MLLEGVRGIPLASTGDKLHHHRGPTKATESRAEAIILPAKDPKMDHWGVTRGRSRLAMDLRGSKDCIQC